MERADALEGVDVDGDVGEGVEITDGVDVFDAPRSFDELLVTRLGGGV